MTDTNTQPAQQQDNSKLLLILTYILGWVGVLIAYFMTKENRPKVVAYHMRQMIGFTVIVFVAYVAATIVGIILGILGVAILIKIFGFAMLALYVCILVLWVFGLIAALKSEEKPMPVIGQLIQDKLAKVFA